MRIDVSLPVGVTLLLTQGNTSLYRRNRIFLIATKNCHSFTSMSRNDGLYVECAAFYKLQIQLLSVSFA